MFVAIGKGTQPPWPRPGQLPHERGRHREPVRRVAEEDGYQQPPQDPQPPQPQPPHPNPPHGKPKPTLSTGPQTGPQIGRQTGAHTRRGTKQGVAQGEQAGAQETTRTRGAQPTAQEPDAQGSHDRRPSWYPLDQNTVGVSIGSRTSQAEAHGSQGSRQTSTHGAQGSQRGAQVVTQGVQVRTTRGRSTEIRMTRVVRTERAFGVRQGLGVVVTPSHAGFPPRPLSNVAPSSRGAGVGHTTALGARTARRGAPAKPNEAGGGAAVSGLTIAGRRLTATS